MNEYLFEKRYERNMQHNYLILQEKVSSIGTEEKKPLEQYVQKMLLENHIPRLLPITNRLEDGELLYCYEINSMQPLDRLFERKPITYEDIRILVESYAEAICGLEEYLLDQEGILLDAEYIYYHAGENKMDFVYSPYAEKKSLTAFQELTEYLLMKTDHTDEKAVKTVYQLYKAAREENFNLNDMLNIFKEPVQEVEYGKTQMQERRETYSHELRMDEVPFAPEPIEEMEEIEPVKETVQGKRSKLTSNICMVFAVICLGGLAAEKVLLLYSLPEQYEMILFAAIVMFAVAGVVFRLLGEKQNQHALEAEQVKEEQRRMIYEEFEPERTYGEKSGSMYVSASLGKEKTLEDTSWSDWGEMGETTVIGISNQRTGSILRRVDGQSNEEYALNRFPFLIGRMAQRVDLVLNDSSVSKMHARIEEKEGRLFLQDMNSTNGTMKNGKLLKLNESIPMDIGDELTFGKMTFRYL